MFTNGKTRADRGFAKGACKMTSAGTFGVLAHSTYAEPGPRLLFPQLH
jgi:hypothetical protein